MIFVGDYFAIVVVLLIAMFFIDRKHAQTTDSKVYLTTLILIFLTAVSDIGTGCMDGAADVPLWANICVNTLYFLMNILSTSCIAVYLFRKILEHSHNKHCMKYALRGLAVLLGVYVVFLVVNVFNGCLFYFDANNVYLRGPWNGVGYMITILQMGLVGVCYVRNRSNASNTMRRILVISFPLIVVSIIIQRIIPEIILNSMLMALFCAVLFMIYNGQRPGVHALTRLNDRHRFFEELDDYFAKKAPFQTPEECLHILKNVPKLKFVIDTGNFYFPKSDLIAAWELLKDYTVHVHVKDWMLVEEGTGIPAPDGEFLCSVSPDDPRGVTATDTFLKRIAADGFKGSLVAEYNGFKAIEDELDQMLAYYKQFQ